MPISATFQGPTLLKPLPSGRMVLLFSRYARIEHWAPVIHAAPFWRFYLPVSGCAHITYGTARIPLELGIPMLIPPGTSFRTSHRAAFTKLYSHVSITWPGMDAAPGIYQIRTAGLRARCSMLIRSLSDSSDRSSPMQFWLKLTATISDAVALLPDTVFHHASFSPHIMSVIERMQLALAKPLSNRALADLIGMHENSFIRLFRQETGAAPAAYYRSIRLNAAAELLAERSAVIEDIAQRTGFCDRDHFTRAFTSHFSLPPARYRRMVHGG